MKLGCNNWAYQPVEVTLGQISGDMVEVKTGLFEGDMIVTGRATQLYAQSLRGGSKQKDNEHTEAPSQAETKTPSLPVPLWLVGVGGGAIAFGTALCAIATIAFISGAFIAGRRPKHQPSAEFAFLSEESSAESSAWDDNHRVTPQESKSHQK
jgi:cobalt-zinc-cadmium efflux system membrane fusion protein